MTEHLIHTKTYYIVFKRHNIVVHNLELNFAALQVAKQTNKNEMFYELGLVVNNSLNFAFKRVLYISGKT